MTAAPSPTGDRLGLVIGHSLPDDAMAADARPIDVDTPWGPVGLLQFGEVVVLPRHGRDAFTLAHALDHHRNIAALCAAGCDRVVALGSVGSLRAELPVGSVVAPDDFFAPHANPTFFTDRRGHRVPGFDLVWRATVVDAWTAETGIAVAAGTYAQTVGPRFETPAEIRHLGQHAHVVGMTLASECVLAGEAGLAYAALCTVDNPGNGLEGQLLDIAAFHAQTVENRDVLRRHLLTVIERLAATPLG